MALRGVPGVRRLSDATTSATSSGMLDAGEARLVALAARLPGRIALAARAGLPLPPAEPAELLARVARHRGVDFASLAAASGRLQAVADGVRRRHVALAEEAGTLWESWAGDDADDVADGVGDVARAAHGVVVTLEEAATLLEDTAVTVADAVAALAVALGELPLPGREDGAPVGIGGGEGAGDTSGTAGTADIAVLRARAAAVDGPLHRLLAVLDRTDEVVDQAWADLADGVVGVASAAATATATATATRVRDGAGEDVVGLEAMLAEVIGPVAVTRTPGSREGWVRPPR